MSDTVYKVPVTRILNITPHSNAHSLEVAWVYGFQVIVKKDKYKVGDRVIYVPIDSVLPKWLEDTIFPSTKDENGNVVPPKIKLTNGRVRQIRIRGLASQGMIVDPNDVNRPLSELFDENDIKEALGIIKYEPPQPVFAQIQGRDKQRNKQSEHPLFHKYNGLNNIKWLPDFFKEGEEVVIQEKLHGCVQSTTRIRLSDGTCKTIKEIVDDRLPVKVLGVDGNGKVVESKILNYFNNGTTNDWYRIKVSRENAGRGKHVSSLTVTGNHKFFDVDKNEYLESRELSVGQKVYLLRQDFGLTYIESQVLIGKMLGDGSLSSQGKSVSFNQSKKQEGYLDYTLEMLGPVAGNKTSESISGYGTTMCRARTVSRKEIEDLFCKWTKNGKKEIPEDMTLSPISMSFWYMDDGSLVHSDGQEDRAAFAVCGFSVESCENLVNALKRLDIDATVKNYDGYNRIFLNADNADKLFVLISPYIPQCMQYKLPERYRNGSAVFVPPKKRYNPELTIQTVMEIKKDTSRSYDRYDIETETHNYFANNVLTHNSNARTSKLPYNANTLWKKFKKMFGLAPSVEKCYGSNNVDISSKSAYSGFYGEDVYGSTFTKMDVFSKLRLGETVYGEIIGPGIQKNYSYGLKEHRFVLFDVKILDPKTKKQHWLNPEEVEAFAKQRGFDLVPILYKGPFSKELAYSLTKGESVYCPKQKVREGIVIKAAKEYSADGNKRALKWISEDYLDDKNNSDFH